MQHIKPILALSTLAALTLTLAAAGGFWLGRIQGTHQPPGPDLTAEQAYQLSIEADPFWRVGGRRAPLGDSQTLKFKAENGDIRAALSLSNQDTFRAADASQTGSPDEAKFLLSALQTEDEAYSILYRRIQRLALQHPKPWPIF